MTVREQSQPVDTEHADTGATAQEKAQQQEKENEQAAEEMRELEAETRRRASTTGPTARPSS